jgi:hypothetical protein
MQGQTKLLTFLGTMIITGGVFIPIALTTSCGIKSKEQDIVGINNLKLGMKVSSIDYNPCTAVEYAFPTSSIIFYQSFSFFLNRTTIITIFDLLSRSELVSSYSTFTKEQSSIGQTMLMHNTIEFNFSSNFENAIGSKINFDEGILSFSPAIKISEKVIDNTNPQLPLDYAEFHVII